MKKLINPAPADIADTVEAFICDLAEPCIIFLEGEDTSRTRGLVTLMHGNEPSGVRALHRWLLSGEKPLFNVVCVLPAVPAAILEPLFKYRVYPGQRDMNRCFLPPYSDEPGKRAEAILEAFEHYAPECIIDIHNTSGHSPDFAVVTFEDEMHESLVSLFTERLIITHLRLGALMETSQRKCPVVTIECGGAQDEESDQIAWQGLVRYFRQPDVLTLESGHQLDLYHHPVRLELSEDCVVAYADSYVLGSDLTVPAGLDRCNFGTVEPGELIGWVGRKKGVEGFCVHDAAGKNVFSEYFQCKGNQLLTAQRLKLFMITTRPDIAISDCLLYAAKESEHDIIAT